MKDDIQATLFQTIVLIQIDIGTEYTDLFIFRFVSLLCLRNTLRLF